MTYSCNNPYGEPYCSCKLTRVRCRTWSTSCGHGPTAAIPIENPCCSCKLTAFSDQGGDRQPVVAGGQSDGGHGDRKRAGQPAPAGVAVGETVILLTPPVYPC